MKRVKHRILFGVLVLLLAGSFVVNIILFRQARVYYVEMNAIRLDPLGLSHYSNMKEMTKSVVFYGDSRAYDWPAPDIDGLKFFNRGVQGETSAQSALRFDYHVKPLHPEIIILQVGINDLKTVAVMPEKYDEIVENCKANIELIVEKAQAVGAKVVVTTIFPTGMVPFYRQVFWSDDVVAAVESVNAFIWGLNGEGVFVFDSYAILVGEDDKIKPEYALDTLHLSDSGYRRLNEELTDFLKEVE